MATDSARRDAPAYPVGSVDKALRLLLVVAERPDGLRVGDAAALLGIAPSTAHRLLQMLAHYGFAEQDPESKMYRAGPTMERLSNFRGRVIDLARPILERLVALTQETVHLATLDGDRALTLLSVESPHLLRVGDRSGHSQPAYSSAMGKALLAGMGGDIEPHLPNGLQQSERENLLSQLEVIRERGYSAQDGEVESGVSAVAVSVGAASAGISGAGTPAAGFTGASTSGFAIGITFPTGRIGVDRWGEVLAAARKAADELADALAGSGR
ncbi:IclR family transcriptional regulator [Rhodococcus sp. C26F]